MTEDQGIGGDQGMAGDRSVAGDRGVAEPGVSRAEAEAREDDLQGGLAHLADMVAWAVPLEDLLAQVALAASHAIAGADGVGVTLMELNQPTQRIQTIAVSDPFVTDIDRIQYDVLGHGPCITAAAERRIIRSGNITADPRWPRLGHRLGRLGVHSVLALPMLLPDQSVVGAINAYSRSRDVFDTHANTLAESFAGPAAIAIHNAHLLDQARNHATQLQHALTSRAVIDQAIGIIRGLSGATAEEAFDRLRAMSQTDHITVAEIAQRLVEDAASRARTRRTSH